MRLIFSHQRAHLLSKGRIVLLQLFTHRESTLFIMQMILMYNHSN